MSTKRVAGLALGACVAALALHAYPVCRPMLLFDDFQIVIRSWTWSATCANLWLPANEHVMPLGRLSTWVLNQIAGLPTNLPLITALQGPVALVAAMVLLCLFVRRELGHPFYGLVAMILFGVSSSYQNAVNWFAASFTLLALDTMLLALLAAQKWRQGGAAVYLALSAVGACLAPAWFASGILAGPLCSLYLLVAKKENRIGKERQILTEISRILNNVLIAFVPLLGTLVFLVVSLPGNFQRILYTGHYQGKSAWEAVHLDVGLVYTGRSLVDNLALGSLGISGVVCSPHIVVGGLLLLTVTAVAWLWISPCRPLGVLGLAMIGLSYWLVYSARAEWSYDSYLRWWSRYQLWPHLGLTLFLCGGLPAFQGRFVFLSSPGLSLRQIWGLAVFLGLLFVTQEPRGYSGSQTGYDPRQREELRLVEETDARCRQQRISAAAAKAALGRLDILSNEDRENCWDLLRGSDDPLPHSQEEIRRLLQAPPPES